MRNIGLFAVILGGGKQMRLRWPDYNVRKAGIISLVGLGFMLPGAGPVMAGLVVPPAQSTFQTCSVNSTVAGLSSVNATCITGGNFFLGTVTMDTFLAAGGPTAQTTATGVDVFGIARLTYYVGVQQIAPPPFLPSTIPVDFGVFIGASGATNSGVAAQLRAEVSSFSNVSGNLLLDHPLDTPEPTSVDVLLANSGTLQFEIDEGDAIARVDLFAGCGIGLLTGFQGGGSVTCSADPLVGFDQAAFDTKFGASSFTLADYFGFVFSDGLDAPPPSSVPEPATILLFGMGLAGMAAARRRKQHPPTA